MGFSKDFLWGAASAAFQVEGAYDADGKGMGIWDVMAKAPGKIDYDETGDVSADHYHRYKEDVALMKKIGLKCYRFSVSWPRVLPEGIGRVNEAGLDFYSSLVDELLAAGIEPMVTLFHWNMPYALYEKGGWSHADAPDWFAEYARVVVERLSDRVKYWTTFNEFQSFVGVGHVLGVHAPFENHMDDLDAVVHISNQVLKAHGRAVQAIRKYALQPVQIGLSPGTDCYIPKNNSAEAIEEARSKTFALAQGPFFTLGVSWWMDPIFLGDYPQEAYERMPEAMAQVTKEDLEIISQPLDFYAVNIYQAMAENTSYEKPVYNEYVWQGSPMTTSGGYITPEVMYWAPKFLYERYQKPVFITENGLPTNDWVSLDGGVHDTQRIDFLHRYLLELERAADDNIPVIGYLHWSIMDNMEWTKGYRPRYGLIHVDYRTMKRTLKDSAYWYAEVIKNNGALHPEHVEVLR